MPGRQPSVSDMGYLSQNQPVGLDVSSISTGDDRETGRERVSNMPTHTAGEQQSRQKATKRNSKSLHRPEY